MFLSSQMNEMWNMTSCPPVLATVNSALCWPGMILQCDAVHGWAGVDRASLPLTDQAPGRALEAPAGPPLRPLHQTAGEGSEKY